MIVYGEPSHRAAIAQAAHCQFFTTDPVIARVKDGRLLGGVVFENYTGSSICIHSAGFDPRWLNRKFLCAVFSYPFVQLKCRVLFGPTPAANERACKINLKYGFKPKYRIENVFPDGDMILFAMTPDDCRWINLGQRQDG